MNNAINIAAASLTDDIKALRLAGRAVELKGTNAARSIIAALLADLDTADGITARVLTVFGNPKTPKGKAITALTTSSADDSTPGFGTVRRNVADILDLWAHVDYDKARDAITDDDGNIVSPAVNGTGAMRAMLTGFVLKADGAPANLAALKNEKKRLIAAHIEANMPEKTEEEKAADAEDAANAPASEAFNMGEAIATLMVAIKASDAATWSANRNAMLALIGAIEDRDGADIATIREEETVSLAA